LAVVACAGGAGALVPRDDEVIRGCEGGGAAAGTMVAGFNPAAPSADTVGMYAAEGRPGNVAAPGPGGDDPVLGPVLGPGVGGGGWVDPCGASSAANMLDGRRTAIPPDRSPLTGDTPDFSRLALSLSS